MANESEWEGSIDSLYKISINAMWQVEENFEETSEKKKDTLKYFSQVFNAI